METSGHIATNPGLRGHSVNPDQNLMGRYMLGIARYGSDGRSMGWLYINSWNDVDRAAYEWTVNPNLAHVYDSVRGKVLLGEIRHGSIDEDGVML